MFATIPEAIEELKAGRMIVVVDDEDRENEGDLVIAAEKITPETMNFILRYGRGTDCLALTGETCDRLGLRPQTDFNTATLGTAFTITFDAHPKFGVTTGVSARDKATSCLVAISPDAVPHDLLRPGHMVPLRAVDGGVLVRSGHTEGSIDLCRLAGLRPAAVICEILREDGELARRAELEVFCREHNLKMVTIADLISYRLHREQFVKRVESITLPTKWGVFTLHAYSSPVDAQPNLALTKGGIGDINPDGTVTEQEEPVLVRVHSECLTGDVFGSGRCDCGDQLSDAMQMLEAAGKGAVIYLRQEGRGIGLVNKLHAYKLQEQGLDTVDANLRLGLPADKRDYGIGSQILRDLGIRKIKLITNNPKKIHGLDGFGLQIVEQVPIRVIAGEHNRDYLEVKRTKMGHTL
ncbi:MAG TPA: bifunctional 3,4-dihydroxy-2-butanone-4-phosphate synthase/GTP cyclohydrolase II [Tepidisphaeraceae bacterium]|jgi:3,4-dihydroxy 2-butanone 4-phosphate synthase/GTP cyclohydrolase II